MCRAARDDSRPTLPIEGVYLLERVRDARQRLEGRGVSGKLLLEVSSAS